MCSNIDYNIVFYLVENKIRRNIRVSKQTIRQLPLAIYYVLGVFPNLISIDIHCKYTKLVYFT